MDKTFVVPFEFRYHGTLRLSLKNFKSKVEAKRWVQRELTGREEFSFNDDFSCLQDADCQIDQIGDLLIGGYGRQGL